VRSFFEPQHHHAVAARSAGVAVDAVVPGRDFSQVDLHLPARRGARQRQLDRAERGLAEIDEVIPFAFAHELCRFDLCCHERVARGLIGIAQLARSKGLGLGIGARVAVAVPDPYLPGVCFVWRQRVARILNVGRPARRDFARVPEIAGVLVEHLAAGGHQNLIGDLHVVLCGRIHNPAEFGSAVAESRQFGPGHQFAHQVRGSIGACAANRGRGRHKQHEDNHIRGSQGVWNSFCLHRPYFSP